MNHGNKSRFFRNDSDDNNNNNKDSINIAIASGKYLLMLQTGPFPENHKE